MIRRAGLNIYHGFMPADHEKPRKVQSRTTELAIERSEQVRSGRSLLESLIPLSVFEMLGRWRMQRMQPGRVPG